MLLLAPILLTNIQDKNIDVDRYFCTSEIWEFYSGYITLYFSNVKLSKLLETRNVSKSY